MISDIIGITISSPGYHEMAQEAARRFRKYTGCDALILTTERRDSYDAKYALPFLGDRTICFFDADLWLIRQTNLAPLSQINGIAAVKDVTRHAENGSFCLQDARLLQFSPEEYCNTGFMVINPLAANVKEAFNLASSLMAKKNAGCFSIIDVTEQSLLNAAFIQSGVEMTYLGNEWNFWPNAWKHGFYQSLPLHPYCIHAAGVLLPNKMQFLKDQCKVWEF